MQIRFTLDQLQVLEAIDRTGTFAGAGQELHRVPSAISYVVRTLEESLELKLFDRSRQKAALTAAGRRILEEGAAVLEQARKMDALAHQIETGWEPELHIVVDGIVALGPVTRALRIFRDEQIPTRLRLDIEYQEGVPDRWEADEADLIATDAQRLGIDQITPDLPLKGIRRVVLCCRSGQRAWAAAEELSGFWSGSISLIAAGDPNFI